MIRNIYLILLLTMLQGCVTIKGTNVGGIDGTDIFKVPQGAIIHIPKDSVIRYTDKNGVVVNIVSWDRDTDVLVVKNGRFYSDQLMNDIIDSK